MNSRQRRAAWRKAITLLVDKVEVSYPAWFGGGARRVGRVVEVECGRACLVKFAGVTPPDVQRVTVARLRERRRP